MRNGCTCNGVFNKELSFWEGDLCDYNFVEGVVREFQPDAVVHVGECPSAPYSMIDVHHAVFVQNNNINSTFNLLFALRDHRPKAHLVKLGTMGEYGTPDMDIPEGFFEIEYRGRKARLSFPRQAGSWYHWSKVHGSNNIMFACKLWGLSATDAGVWYSGPASMQRKTRGLEGCISTRHLGRRSTFCCQAVVGHPLTRMARTPEAGFAAARFDAMPDLALENPAKPGEYRVFNH